MIYRVADIKTLELFFYNKKFYYKIYYEYRKECNFFIFFILTKHIQEEE